MSEVNNSNNNNFSLTSFHNNINNNYKTEHDKIAGLYNLGPTIGKGHYAVVKEAKHAFTGEKVAIKVIDKTKLEPQSRQHLYSEVVCMKLVQHPNVVRLYEVIDTAHKLYLVLELGDGGDLYDYIMKFERGLPELEAQRYFRQIVRAIAYCHNLHVVHRDLKPENVVFFEKLELVKLTDFGFSNKFTPGKTLDTSCGSLAYSAPEILLGDAYDAPKVDIWSLGVILFMLVCGRLPFEEANDSETLSRIMDCRYELPGHLSDGCKRLIGKMLVRRPEDRSSLDEILSDSWLRSAGGDLSGDSVGARLDSFSVPLISQELLTVEEHLEILTKMSEGNLASVEEIQSVLDRDEYSYISATYFLLAERKLKRRYLENYCKMKLLEIETAESEPAPPPPAPPLTGTTSDEFPVESNEERIRRFSMILEDEEDEAEEEELEAMMSLASVREELETAPQRPQEPSAPFPSRCCSRLSDSIDPGFPESQHDNTLQSSDFGRSSAFRAVSYSRNSSNPPANNNRCRSAIFNRRSQIYSSHSLTSIPSLSRLATDDPGNSNNNNPLVLSIKSPHKSSRLKLSSLLSPISATGFNPPSSSTVVPRFHRLNFSRRTSSICSCFVATVATNRSQSTNQRQSMSFDDNFHYMNCRYFHRPSLPNAAAASSTPSYYHGNNVTRKRCSYPALFSLHPVSASMTAGAGAGAGHHLPVVNSNNSHSSSDVSDTEVAIWRGFTERKPTVVPKSFGKQFQSSISNSSIDSDGGGSAYGGAATTQKLIPNCRRMRMKSGRSRPSSMGATMGSRLEDFQLLLAATASNTSGTVTAASTVTIIDPPGVGMMSAGGNLQQQTTVSSSPTAVSNIAPHRDIYAPIHEEDELIRSRSYIDSNHYDSRSISHRLVSLDYRGRRQSESADTTPAKWLPWVIERQAPRACKRPGCSAPAGTPTVIGSYQVPGTTPANRHSRSLSSQLTQSNFSLSSFASSLRDSKAMMNLVRGAFELQCSANRSSSAASNRNARHPDACASATVSGRESRCEFASVTSLPLGNKLLHSPDDSMSRMNYESIIEHEKQAIIDDNHHTADHSQSTEKPLIPKQSICSNYSDANAATVLIADKSVNKSLSMINNNSNSSTNPFLRAGSNMSRKARFILSCCRPS